MAERSSRRFPIWAFVVLGLLIVATIAGFCIPLILRSAEDRRWAEMRQWCEGVAKEVRSRDARRPVLRGIALDGNAWEDYREALNGLTHREILPVGNVVARLPSADPSKARDILIRFAPALRSLKLGASRAEARRSHDWENGRRDLPSPVNYLGLLAACQSRFLVEEGKPREAMQLLLDTALYGEDAGFNGTWFNGLEGLEPVRLALNELKDLLSSRLLTPQDLRELERELEILDRGFPREAEALAIEPMRTGFHYLRAETISAVLKAMEIDGPSRPTWRYGFSDRLVLVGDFQSEVFWCRRMQEAGEKPWSEARRIQQEVRADQSQSPNPLQQRYVDVRQSLRSSDSPDSPYRGVRAQLRLVRSVATYRASGSLPPLDDPFGDKIFTAVVGTRLKVWSVGNDGVDDGGSGEWSNRQAKDIVLEVER